MTRSLLLLGALLGPGVLAAPASPPVAPASAPASSLLPHLDVGAPAWKPYLVKPPVLITTRLDSQDGGCGTHASGLLLKQAKALPAGQYVVSFDARTVGGTLTVQYGLNDRTTATADLTGSWRGYQQTFTWDGGAKITPAAVRAENVNRVFQIAENVEKNTPWEVRRLSVRRRAANGTLGPNLLPTQDPQAAPWLPYCAAAKLTTTVMFLGRDASADNPRSGVLYSLAPKNLPAGQYRVSFTGRSLSGPMEIVYGLNDGNTRTALLDREWTPFTADFRLAAPKGQGDRVVQLFETGPRNTPWEIRDLRVEKLP
ncbi:hypothetical protein [Deinococcus ficus]|uniref:hypothetical protein n=1 Tax=Deinococcus ficus TaxID=317577 RepID=UPI0003B4C753|nr:hypothetical protein [Deinococcus ficus]